MSKIARMSALLGVFSRSRLLRNLASLPKVLATHKDKYATLDKRSISTQRFFRSSSQRRPNLEPRTPRASKSSFCRRRCGSSRSLLFHASILTAERIQATACRQHLKLFVVDGLTWGCKYQIIITIFYDATPCSNGSKGNIGCHLAVLATVLSRGKPAKTMLGKTERLLDGSHVCHERLCVNSDHIIFETCKQNNIRFGCRNGAAFLCACPNLRCVWQRDGHFLVCRNDPNKRELVCDEGCELRCFGTFALAYF